MIFFDKLNAASGIPGGGVFDAVRLDSVTASPFRRQWL